MLNTDRRTGALLPLILAFLLIVLMLVSAFALSLQQQTSARWVRHTLEIESELNALQVLATDAETGQRGYILTGKRYYIIPYEHARDTLPSKLTSLEKKLKDDLTQAGRVSRLEKVIVAKLAELKVTIDRRKAGDLSGAMTVINNDSGARMMSEIRSLINLIRQENQRLLEERSVHADRFATLTRVILAGSAAITVFIAIWAVRDGRRRIRALSATNTQLVQEAAARRAADDQVRQLQKMESIGQLTGGIAHDFNNMLAIVIGSLDMARRRLVGTEHPSIKKCLDNATEGAERAAVLTARLLAFSRQQALDPKVLDANKLVGGMSELLRRTIGEPVRIETVLAGGLWRTCVDAGQLENALVNLAVNARDAMPDGGRITIETSNADLDDRYAREHVEVAAGQYVLISVTDTGVGMSAAVVQRAFEPFYTTKGVGKGTGLGLSQVFGFIKQSGGHVKIYSEVGEGTTIKIYLPRYTGKTDVQEARFTPGELPTGRTDEIILVVEDEEKVRHVSVDALRELGYTVIQAATPSDALQQLALQPSISMIFTDIVMPEMSGRELVDLALVQRPHLKVVYTTGYTRNAVVHNGVLDPGTNFLPKPFTLEQLALKIRSVLDEGAV